MPNFPKTEHFLPPDTHTYVCVSGFKKCLFFEKFGVICFLETPILRFALLSYYRRILVVAYLNTWILIGTSLKWYASKIHTCIVNANTLKKTRSLFKKWSLNLWWISNKTIIEVENITKGASFKSLLYLSHKDTQLLFLWQCFLNNLIRQTLSTDDFWGLHKNMNCAVPLKNTFVWSLVNSNWKNKI